MNTTKDEQILNNDNIAGGYDDNKPDGDYIDRGRTYCGYEDAVLEDHAVKRYLFCLDYVKEGDVCLDAACGTGYGSNILSRKAAKIIGLEISEHALKYAAEKYGSDRIEFHKADLTKPIDLQDNFIDIIVSVETLEHIRDKDNMLSEFQRILKPGGTVIFTTVEHYIYYEKGGIRNEFHIGELTKKELIAQVSKYFQLGEIYGHLKYVPLRWYNKLFKDIWISFILILAKIDVFGLRYIIIKNRSINNSINTLNKKLSVMVETDFEKVSFEEENKYYQLLVVACKTQ